jgi:hypothetical protein
MVVLPAVLVVFTQGHDLGHPMTRRLLLGIARSGDKVLSGCLTLSKYWPMRPWKVMGLGVQKLPILDGLIKIAL